MVHTYLHQQMFTVNVQGVAVSEASYQLITKKRPLGTLDVGLNIDLKYCLNNKHLGMAKFALEICTNCQQYEEGVLVKV